MKKIILILMIAGLMVLSYKTFADDKKEAKVESTKVIDVDTEKENKIKAGIAEELENVVSSKGLSEISKRIQDIASNIKKLFWSEICKVVTIVWKDNKLYIGLEITIPDKPKELSKEELVKINDTIDYHLEQAKILKKKISTARNIRKKSDKKKIVKSRKAKKSRRKR